MKNSIKSASLLVVGKTSNNTNSGSFERYIGFGKVNIIAVNPNKQQLQELTGREIEKEPEYTFEDQEGVKCARITFYVRTVADECNGIDTVSNISFVLKKQPCISKENNAQIIDEYGNSTWINAESAKNHAKPLSKAGKTMSISDNYHIGYRGEAELVTFLKIFLGVRNAFKYIDGSWVLGDNTEDCKFGLEHIKDYFSGDFSEINEAYSLQPNNMIKLMFGIKTNQEGKVYQTICNNKDFFLYHFADARAIEKAKQNLIASKQQGLFSSEEYDTTPIHVWSVTPTDLNATAVNAPAAADQASDPMAPAVSGSTPWDDNF